MLVDGEEFTSMTEYLSRLCGDGMQDEETGESSWGDGWCARLGKHLLFSSEFTGDSRVKYPTEADAKQAFWNYEQEWLQDPAGAGMTDVDYAEEAADRMYQAWKERDLWTHVA